MDGTVPVTSRRAYNLPSAGARSPLCPVSTRPMRSQLAGKLLDGQIGAVAGDRFHLIQRAAAEPQPAARHLPHRQPAGRHGRLYHQGGLIAHPAG